jgi:hypothetical protein
MSCGHMTVSNVLIGGKDLVINTVDVKPRVWCTV